MDWFALIAHLILSLAAAFGFAYQAKKQGKSGKLYFVAGLLLWPIPLLAVLWSLLSRTRLQDPN